MSLTKKKFRIGVVSHFTENDGLQSTPLEVKDTWLNSFTYKKEDQDNEIEGLRSPQIGAIHATLAHWEVSTEPATIVMPTGTGKTETMLSLLIISQCRKLLVVVPTDALRTQIANKFIKLGLLGQLGLVNERANLPFVGVLDHKPKDTNEINEFFDACNVVVTTMSIVGSLNPALQNGIAQKCSHLFIDEAHHIAAKTWNSFKDAFSENLILQFTATPFRNDDKPINDKIIFNYPLSKAQNEGYFKQIDFLPIYEWDPELYDISIAEKAVTRLREDLKAGYNHVLMARVSSIDRANNVFEIYKKYEDLPSILIHSKSTNKEEIRRQIENVEFKIIVCVDMLGEGFDLPQLKVAAFHDIKKSLPITLQLAGRFTRSSRDNELGNASIIVNLATTEAEDELEQLYAFDSDWNKILPLLSQDTIQDQVDFFEFINGFNKFPNEIQLQNIKPALSTVVYQTNTKDWFPKNFKKGIPGIENFDQVFSDINTEERILVVVTGNRNSVKWGKIENLFELTWTLSIIYWNQEKQLLFINSSENGGAFEKLADAVTFDTATLIKAEDIFKCLSGVAQIKVNNVGLKNQLDKLLSFTMHVGQDVETALTKSQTENKIKSNVFCTGFEDGEKITIGCSYKGRVWAKKTANLEEFVQWCNHLGDKMLNANINPDDVLKNAIFPKTIIKRPELYPISIDWNEDLYLQNEDAIYLVKGELLYPIYHFDIELINPSVDGRIQFQIKHNDFSSIYELEFLKVKEREIYRFNCVSEPLSIKIGRTTTKLVDYFYDQSPIIRFVDGSYLEGNMFSEYKYKGAHYDRALIENWDWVGVDIKKESQGINKIADSIQYKVIQKLKGDNYDVIFDDDNSGEIADIIAVKVDDLNHKIQIELYHLKYSHGENAGGRINDLYEVCGQAQKSILWKAKGADQIFKRMIKRTQNTEKQRIETGDIKTIGLLKDKSKRTYATSYKIFVVQPGLSKAATTEQQLELLAVTENHLMETYRIKFGVIASN